jgi:hypothetical protein
MTPFQTPRTRIFDRRPFTLRRAASRGTQGLRFLASPAVLVLAICLSAGHASAQEKPFLRIDLSPDAAKAKDLSALVLRPNVEQDRYRYLVLRPNLEQDLHFFVTNPTNQLGKFKVSVSGVDAEVSVAAGKTEPVSFAKPAPPPPPAPAPGAAPPAADAKTPWVDLKDSPPSLDIRFSEVGGADLVSGKFPISLARATSYLETPKVNYDAKGGGLLTVEVAAKANFVGKPCIVQLILPDMIVQGRPRPLSRDYDLRGVIGKPSDKVTLFAKILKVGPPQKPEIHLAVDGDANAFIFDTEFKLDGPVQPRSESESYRIPVPRYAPAGEKFPVRVEVNNAPPGQDLELAFGIDRDGAFEKKQVHKLTGSRDLKARISPTGANGALLIQVEGKDWVKDVDIGGVQGERILRVRPLKFANDATVPEGKEGKAVITFDGTPPEDVQFVDPPANALQGAFVPFKATGKDDDSLIQEVVFFLGKPPADGKIPPTLDTYKATKDSKDSWSANVPMPTDKKGPTLVSVLFFNGAGLSTPASATVVVLDPAAPKPPPAPGKIEGTLLEGTSDDLRPQPKLDVVLLDEKGVEKGKAKTDAKGKFVFDNVEPGKYKITAVSTASRSKAEQSVLVKSGATVKVEAKLFSAIK